MKAQLKIAIVAGLLALTVSSCQKEEIGPDTWPENCYQTEDGGNMRIGGPEGNEGGALGDDGVIVADSTGIVSGGDDDRDGGGVVGGGDDDKDGGKKKAEDKKP